MSSFNASTSTRRRLKLGHTTNPVGHGTSGPRTPLNSAELYGVLENLLEGCFVIGRDYSYRFLNAEASRHARRPRHELLGRTMMEAFPGIEHTELFRAVRRCMNERRAQRLEIEFEFPGGDGGCFELRIQPTPEGVLVLSIDVTEQRRVQAAQRRDAERMQRLTEVMRQLAEADSLPAIAELACGAARALTSSDSAAFLKREESDCVCLTEEQTGSLWQTARVPLTACPAGWAMLRAEPVTRADVLADPEVPQARFDGAPVRGLAVTPILAGGQPIGALGVYWEAPHVASDEELRLLQLLADATSVAAERVRVIDELADSEERYRGLVENLEDVVVSVDAEGCITYASPAVTKYGYRVDEVLGASFVSFIHPADVTVMVEAMAKALDGHVQTSVFRLLAKDGTEHHVRTAGRPVIRDGQVRGINGVMIDVTELRRTEEQLRVAQKMEAIGQLAGGIAHDFNNLLSVILSYAGFVADEVREQPTLRDDVEEIRKAATRAATLTRQLLAFSRKQVMAPRPLDLNHLTTELDKMLQRVLGEHIVLEHELTDELGWVTADPSQLEQVIMNLVVNARDAMPEGGRLTIATRNLDVVWGDEHELPPGRWVALSIRDTGCGMDDQTRARLFEPFFTTKDVGKGTGLGLSIVYGIVTQSGGSVHVDSRLGQGSTFTVLLPRTEAPALPAHNRVASLPPPGDETVLLVEDDAAVRQLATRILKEAGYHVLVAANCAEALSCCGSSPGRIDLLVTDVVMPQGSGQQLAAELVARRPGLRVLYMSGYANHPSGAQAPIGPDAQLISKPFSVSELRKKVRQVLDGAPAAAVVQFVDGGVA